MHNIKKKILVTTLIMSLLSGSIGVNGLNPVSQTMKAKAQEIKVQSNEVQEEDYTQYVNPFVGTDVDYGQLFPGSVTPNGLVKLSPDTYPHSTNDHAGYDYSKTQIEGFSHTRIEGVGGQGAGGDVLITPSYVQYATKPTGASRAQNYSHDKEAASPGYYSVELTPKTGTGTAFADDTSFGNIKAELTSNTRTGLHKYTFPKDGDVSVVVDLNYTYHGTDIRNAIMQVEQLSDTTAISGRFTGRNVSGHGKYTMYFYMETSQPATKVQTWLDSTLANETSRQGNDIGAVLNFAAKASTPLEVKVSISPVSSLQAKKDMHSEMAGWDFDTVQTAAKAQWNDILGKVKVENSTTSDPDGKLKKLFYTHLYHMFTTPVNATSTDDTYRATDMNVYKAEDYTHYDSWTLWDDFRKYPMIGLILPDVYKDYIRSLADTMQYGIGTWGIDSQTVPTVRTEHAVALLADGVAKGFDDIDNLEIAYNKSKEIANATVNSTAESLGYIDGRVDKTVEYSYDDWAISLLAKNLGKDEDYVKYLSRSFFYKNLYKADAVTTTVDNEAKTFGLLWPKDSSGNWKTANPEQYGNNSLYQGTLWQYTWWDSNDVNGMLDLIGSQEKMAEELHYLYGMQDPDNGSRMLHTNTNEIDLHTPYLFNFVGEPYNTQYWVRQIYTDKTWNRYSGTGEYGSPIYDYVYKLDPAGFMETMDDDAGTMASMYVSAAMGLFPMAPGDTTFQIGTPFFEKVTLDVGNGKTFVIEANNVSADNYYIQSANLNGESFDRTWVDYSEITRGGTLSFDMGATPSDWASDGVTALSSSDMVDTATYDKTDVLSYSNATIFESDANDGSVDQKLTVSLQNTTAKIVANDGEDLIASGKVVIGNVPTGLTAVASKVNDTSIQISFTGKAQKHAIEDSIGNLSVKLNDSLFSQVITSKRKEKSNIKIMFDDDTIQFAKKKLTESILNDGSITDTVAIDLTGDTNLSGTVGEDFISTGKIKIESLPSGLTASVKKTSSKQLELSVLGKAVVHNVDVDDLMITFQDTAFDGTSASQISGSNYGGMQSLVVDFTGDWKEQLTQIITDAKIADKTQFTTADYNKLVTEIEQGEVVLNNVASTETEYESAYNDIYNILYKVVYAIDGTKKLEAEGNTVWSGGSLKTENGTDSTGASLSNLGATYDGAWIGYENVDFGNKDMATFTVRYVNNSGRCVSDAAMEIRLGSATGELVDTVTLPASGTNWNAYTTKTVELKNSEKLKGNVDLYLVLTGTGAVGTGSGQVFVCNLDWVNFNQANTYGIYQAESYKSWSAGNLKTEASTTSEGESLTNLAGTYDGAWIGYEQIHFGGKGLDKVSLRYASNSTRCPADARIEFRLDSVVGQLVDTISIPPTAGDWKNYVEVEKTLNTKITGFHNVYLILRGTTTTALPYIANIDWFKFTQVVDKTQLQTLYNENELLLADEDKYEAVSFGEFKTALSQLKTLLDSETVTQEELDAAGQTVKDTQAALKLIAVLESIFISKQPLKTQYYPGDTIDTTGLEVTALYNDTKQAVITGYTLSETKAGEVGTQLIKIVYDGKECTLSITVIEKPDSTPIPTVSPTAGPTVSPTIKPTTSPTTGPTASPTTSPTTSPTPTQKPSDQQGQATPVADTKPTSVKLSVKKKTLGVGEKYTVKATVTHANATGTVTFSSNKTSVATVSSKGIITAKKVGTANITVKTINGKTATCSVTVKKAPTSIKTNKKTMTLKINKTYQLKPILSKNSAGSIVYKSSKSSVVSVDKNGKLKARKMGSAVITMKTYNKKSFKVKVTVKK